MSRYLLLLALGLFGCKADQTPTTETPTKKIEVLLKEGTNMAAALSPNKEKLAIDLQGTIWLMAATGGKAFPITDPRFDCHEPTWSPDGTFLAFHSYRGGNYHIWIIDQDGNNLQQITFGQYDDREPHWSADGKQLIFSSDRNGNYDIWVVDIASKEMKALTNAPENEYQGAYSPKGNQIAYVSEKEDGAGIYIMSEDGEKKFRASNTEGQLNSPSWSPEGDKIVYSSFDGQQTLLHLKALNADEASIISTDEDVFPFRASWLNNDRILYTADGKIIKSDLNSQSVDFIPFEATIHLERPDYKRKVYNFDDTEEQPTLGISNPSVSPDGQSVLFTALGDIWIQEIGSNTIKQVTTDIFADIDPVWSPDGTQIAFASDRKGKMDLWTIQVATGKLTQLTDLDAPVAYPVWSPDGRQIAFYQRAANHVWGKGELQVMNLDGKAIQGLEGSYFAPSKSTWSPDGNYLAMMAIKPYSSRYREGLNHIVLLSTKGQAPKYVLAEEGKSPGMRNANGPVWSPDGKHIAYIQDGLLWQLPVDANGNQQELQKR